MQKNMVISPKSLFQATGQLDRLFYKIFRTNNVSVGLVNIGAIMTATTFLFFNYATEIGEL